MYPPGGQGRTGSRQNRAGEKLVRDHRRHRRGASTTRNQANSSSSKLSFDHNWIGDTGRIVLGRCRAKVGSPLCLRFLRGLRVRPAKSTALGRRRLRASMPPRFCTLSPNNDNYNGRCATFILAACGGNVMARFDIRHLVQEVLDGHKSASYYY